MRPAVRPVREMAFRALGGALGLAGLAAATGVPAALADDRDLLRDSVGEPYVFILFDTSGSMHWSPKCTQEQLDAGECGHLCPTGDCYVPLQGDDAGSKLFQAREALYEVLGRTDDVHFGFATYNQDDLRLRAKHWLYRAAGDGPTIPGWGSFPAVGAEEVFGALWPCDTGGGDHEIGCYRSDPADLPNEWERGRVQRLPKGGVGFNQQVRIYVRSAGEVYRVVYTPRSGSLGGDVNVGIEVERCRNNACSVRDFIGREDVDYRVVDEFASWDIGVERSNPKLGYFSQSAANDVPASNTCSGWDANDDTPADRHDGYGARWPTDGSDPRGPLVSVGDIVPLDWQDDHRDDILHRLAPNVALDPTAPPDFRSATYFEDRPRTGEDFLRLKNEAARPLLASGSTPLGNSIRDFRTWWAGCPQGSCPQGSGWSHLAAANDPDWSCRRKFLLVITDGDDTCPGADACSGTAALFAQEGIKTYVVAFGVERSPGNRLQCMAANGGSGEPIYPQNKQELIQALTDIFGQIREEASAFASAAVPSVQAEVADRIFLSSFTPLNAVSVWDGHVNAYLKPLPLTADGKPDRDRACPAPGSSGRSSCHLWDAGEVLLTQAPLQADLDGAAALDPGVLRLGLGETERRVFYGRAPFGSMVPSRLRLFAPPGGDPETDPEWLDLFSGLGIALPTTPAEAADAKDRAEAIIGRTLTVKTSTVEDLGGNTRVIDYLLGDVFHSDPLLVDRPNDFSLYAADLRADPSAASCTGPGSNTYRCFADKHRRRRKMLLVGSNDGQLHAFDAGVWNPSTGTFSDGTGKELFSFMPRRLLPVVRELAEGDRQIFGLDATPRLDDVFIDPQHGGTPNAAQREWRSVVIGGLREGGIRDGGGRIVDFESGYYALDLTQPDPLDGDGTPVNQNVVPGCLAENNQPVAGCGTVAFPALLWEFTDSVAGSRLDEDGNGAADLGWTWSVPTIGRIRVVEGGEVVAKQVAIFGGGFDAESRANPQRGTWLYMVDVETGRPLYKRRLAGAAPADPALLDEDLDGFLDTLYIGTTAGVLYKADLGTPAELADVTIPRGNALPALASDAVERRITDLAWEPYPIFTTGGRPIFFAPTAFFVANLGRFALAFGTGDRENLWSSDGREGRFYLLVDEGFTRAQALAGSLPLDESAYAAILAGGAEVDDDVDFVLSPQPGKQRGWFLRLDEDERVITQSFGLSGILIFSSYQPQIEVFGGGGGPAGGGRAPDEAVCARGGDSRIFVVYAGNANSVMSAGGSPSRFRIVPEFVTSPYVEQGSTKNEAGEGGPNSEQLDEVQRAIVENLKRYYPKGTKFANYWISVSGIRSDTGYERYATIPVGIVQRNWKEH